MNLNRPFDYRYIYVLCNSRYLFRYKIGISDNVSRRTKQIECSLSGDRFEIFVAKFFFFSKNRKFYALFISPIAGTYGRFWKNRMVLDIFTLYGHNFVRHFLDSAMDYHSNFYFYYRFRLSELESFRRGTK